MDGGADRAEEEIPLELLRRRLSDLSIPKKPLSLFCCPMVRGGDDAVRRCTVGKMRILSLSSEHTVLSSAGDADFLYLFFLADAAIEDDNVFPSS